MQEKVSREQREWLVKIHPVFLYICLSPHPQSPPYPKSPNSLIGGQDGGAVYFGQENPCRGGDWVPVWGLVLAGLVFG